jgi:hypothetical protein
VVLVAVVELTSAAGLVSGEDVMAYMLVRNKVRDFDVWKEVFDGDPASAAAGERAGVVEGEIHYVEDVA